MPMKVIKHPIVCSAASFFAPQFRPWQLAFASQLLDVEPDSGAQRNASGSCRVRGSRNAIGAARCSGVVKDMPTVVWLGSGFLSSGFMVCLRVFFRG
jgi:hypothetical protein